MKENHKYITVSGSGIKLLIPNTYELLEQPSIINEVMGIDVKIECAYMANTENSLNAVWAFAPDPQNPKVLDSKQERIRAIHEELGENQGLIEVKEGVSTSGHKYVYSIVKNVCDGSNGLAGVNYFIRLLIEDSMSVIEICGSFEETGMTGKREAVALTLAERMGLCYIGSKGIEGWCKDPYDPSYTRGIPMNLAEKEGLDGLFPESPLSQAREFLYAVLDNKLIVIEQDNPQNSDEHKTENCSKEMIRALFVDECSRYFKQI